MTIQATAPAAAQDARAALVTRSSAGWAPPAHLGDPVDAPITLADSTAAAALEAALRARTAGLCDSTALVRRIATAITRTLSLAQPARELVDLCAQVRDIGMIALPDEVVLATGRLSAADWQLLSTHPTRSAELLQAVHAPAAAVMIVRHHHERWDGQGYPDGLHGTEIPTLSRVIAAADGFVAIARDRPHRRGSGTDAALEQVSREAGAQFDPEIIHALARVITGPGWHTQSLTAGPPPATTAKIPRASTRRAAPDVGRAMLALQSLPAFALAHQRLLDATHTPTPVTGDLVAAIEADLALTLAVMSAAAAETKRAVNTVEDAVTVLGVRGIRDTVATIRLVEFPWRTHHEALLHQVHAHGLLVSRAAARLARLAGRHDEDMFVTLGLLHDIGKLALAQAGADYAEALHPRTGTPEARTHRERLQTGLDHASIGAMALRRAGLPRQLADALHGHHQPDPDGKHAMLLRLADMIVHYSHGDPANRRTLLGLAAACQLSADDIQQVLLDLPHGGGSQRRRAEPSPLTDRETDVLRLLADGLVYTQIGQQLNLAVSTIRSHLHKIYTKLNVVDRAQAVLRATEMGWI